MIYNTIIYYIYNIYIYNILHTYTIYIPSVIDAQNVFFTTFE